MTSHFLVMTAFNLGQVPVTPLSILMVTFLILGKGCVFDGNLGILVM